MSIFGLSFPLFRLFGISVRIHVLFVIWIAIGMLDSKQPWQFHLAEMGILFGSVLLHEFGHSLACRSVGGKADRILLWPLGGLAECDPPLNPWASLWTTVCGPAVNLLLMAAAAGVLYLRGPDADILAKVAAELSGGMAEARSLVKFPVSLNPFDILPSLDVGGGKVDHLAFYGEVGQWLGIVYLYNYVLFLFNMAFVCYPMDAGRVLQEILWLFIGYARSLWVAVHIGLVMAVVLMVMGATRTLGMGSMNIWMGVFFLMRGWSMRQGLAALRDHHGSFAAIPDPRHEAQVGGWLGRFFARAKAQSVAVEIAADQAEIDRILRKVSEFGMASLTPEELATLKGASGE